MKQKPKLSGQALLIIVLVLAIAVTIGLSLVSRTTSDTSMTSQIEDSARAFSAAEAGIEIALKTDAPQVTPVPYGENQALTYATSINDIIPGNQPFSFPPQTTQLGNVGTLYLAEHNPDGSLNTGVYYPGNSVTVCWKGSGGVAPAIEADVYFVRSGAYEVNRVALDISGVTRSPANKFTQVSSTPGNACGQSGVYSQAITVAPQAGDIPLMLRVRPYYSDAIVYAIANSGIPLNISQAKQFSSIGTAPGGVSRQVTVLRQYRSAPSYFDFGVFSQDQLVKN